MNASGFWEVGSDNELKSLPADILPYSEKESEAERRGSKSERCANIERERKRQALQLYEDCSPNLMYPEY